MAKLSARNTDSAPGDWYVDRLCIDCGASRNVAPGLVIRRGELSVFARQPTNEEELAAWRVALVCPTASIGRTSHGRPPPRPRSRMVTVEVLLEGVSPIGHGFDYVEVW
jgi:4Fe-4S single cluster protein